MFERFTEKAIKVVTIAQKEAMNAKHSKLYPEHILLGILKEGSSVAYKFLKSSNLNTVQLSEKIHSIQVYKSNTVQSNDLLPFSTDVQKIFNQSWLEAKTAGSNIVTPEHLFVSLLAEENNQTNLILKDFDVDIEKIKSSVNKLIKKTDKAVEHPENNQNGSILEKSYSSSTIFEEKDILGLMTQAQNILEKTNYEILGTEQIFLAMLESQDSELANILAEEGINTDIFTEQLSKYSSREVEYEESKTMFTPKAYQSINSAYELAKEFGFASIKPEHLLLGILKEKNSIAYKALKDLNINIEGIQSKILSPIQKQRPIINTILKLAKEEAHRLGQKVIGTEEILLGIIGEGTNLACDVLKDLGVTLKEARIEVEKLIGYSNSYYDQDINFTPRAKKILEIAWTKAKKYNQIKIEPEHLLLAIITENECMAMKTLENLGVDALEIKQGIVKAIQSKEALMETD